MDDHPAVVRALARQGLRLTALDVARTRVTAQWTSGEGLPWVSEHHVTPTRYRERFEAWTAGGFRPSCVAASGVSDPAGLHFACVFVKDGTPFRARHELSYGAFVAENQRHRRAGFMLECLTVYGRPWVYDAVWIANPRQVEWTLLDGVDAAAYPAAFGSLADRGYGPCFTTVAKDAEAGTFVILRKGLPDDRVVRFATQASGHAAEIERLLGMGYACGSSAWNAAGDRWTAVFHRQPPARIRRTADD